MKVSKFCLTMKKVDLIFGRCVYTSKSVANDMEFHVVGNTVGFKNLDPSADRKMQSEWRADSMLLKKGITYTRINMQFDTRVFPHPSQFKAIYISSHVEMFALFFRGKWIYAFLRVFLYIQLHSMPTFACLVSHRIFPDNL